MPQLYRHHGVSIYVLIECFFITGFTLLTYKYNVYIALGFLPLYCMLREKIYKGVAFFLILFFLLPILYYVYAGPVSSFRVMKTMIVLLPVYYTNLLKNSSFALSPIFKWFMKINAILVCVDFILYFTVGTTIMKFTESGFMPRPCGLLEDSNFFSYLMLVSIFYYRWKEGRYNKLFVISLLLSGSFSAIGAFTALLIVYGCLNKRNKCSIRMRIFFILATISVMSLYDWIAIHPDEILSIVSSWNINDLIKVKIASMSHRFNTVSNAMSEIDSLEEVLMGIGAGKTRSLSDIGLNLHNSFLQMFLEMGAVLTGTVIFVLLYMVWHIQHLRYVILFCIITMLSSIMETFYNPLLSFVYYISFMENHEHNKI